MPAYAWDDTGHKISAFIAWQQMTPTTREKVTNILRQAPEDSQLATYYQQFGVVREENRKQDYFMIAATWPDIVRDFGLEIRFRNEVRNRKYHKSDWHYADTFWKQVDGNAEALSGFEDGGKALEKLAEFDKLIRAGAPDAQKALAIAWLEHLIGDLHQPLHASARVTVTEPKGDKGGNLFLLTPQGTPRDKQENLHWFWDSIVVRNIPNNKNECEADYLVPLAQKIMKKHPFDKMQGRLAAGRFDDWIKESLALAQTDVFSADLKRFEMPSNKYKKKAFKIAQERLALAGYRMGELFNSAFGTVTQK